MSGATPFICHYSIVFVDVVAVVEGPSTSVILQEPVTHAIQYRYLPYQATNMADTPRTPK